MDLAKTGVHGQATWPLILLVLLFGVAVALFLGFRLDAGTRFVEVHAQPSSSSCVVHRTKVQLPHLRDRAVQAWCFVAETSTRRGVGFLFLLLGRVSFVVGVTS